VRNKQVLSDWLVMLDAVNYAMVESMVKLTQTLVDIVYDTKIMDFDRDDVVRQRDLVPRTPLLPQGDVYLPDKRYFRDVRVPSTFQERASTRDATGRSTRPDD